MFVGPNDNLKLLYSSYFNGGRTVGMVPYSLAASSGTAIVPATTIAQFAQTGSVAMLAYEPTSDRAFIASAIRGQLAVGPNGAGAVYVVNNLRTTPTAPALSVKSASRRAERRTRSLLGMRTLIRRR